MIIIKSAGKKIGFTLIELMVVVVIVTILASISLPIYSTHIEKLKSKEGDQILTTLLAAQQRYKLENGTYATNISDLDIDMPAASEFNLESLSTLDSRVAIIVKRDNSYRLCISSTGEMGCSGSAQVCPNYPLTCI